MITTRIRFDDTEGSFYVQKRYRLLWILPMWTTAKKKGNYSSDDPTVRYFNTYNDARTYSIKMASDVLVKHKRNEYEPMV